MLSKNELMRILQTGGNRNHVNPLACGGIAIHAEKEIAEDLSEIRSVTGQSSSRKHSVFAQETCFLSAVTAKKPHITLSGGIWHHGMKKERNEKVLLLLPNRKQSSFMINIPRGVPAAPSISTLSSGQEITPLGDSVWKAIHVS